jgi:hypothetical protein
MEALEAKHDRELEELNSKIKTMLKAASKKDRIVTEAQTIQVNSLRC